MNNTMSNKWEEIILQKFKEYNICDNGDGRTQKMIKEIIDLAVSEERERSHKIIKTKLRKLKNRYSLVYDAVELDEASEIKSTMTVLDEIMFELSGEKICPNQRKTATEKRLTNLSNNLNKTLKE